MLTIGQTRSPRFSCVIFCRLLCSDLYLQFHITTGSETTPPYAPWSSRFGPEPPSVEDDVDIWRYAISELHARNDDDIFNTEKASGL